jgi:RND family efflux transporter MFP subunit
MKKENENEKMVNSPSKFQRQAFLFVWLTIGLVWLTIGLCAGAQQTAFGITEPFKDSTLSATVAGTITDIKRKEGDFVRKGDVLIELERQQEALEVERRKLIADSKVEVDAAKEQVETLKLDLEGTKKLFEETRSVSKEELQKKELEYKLAQAELERLTIAEEREEIEYRMALVQLQKRIITAPFDGVIVKVFLENGENCSPQQPLVRIADTNKCRLVVHVEASASRNLKKGIQVRVKIDDVQSPLNVAGIVDFVSPVVDPSSGLREVKVLFDNPQGKVRPGVTGVMTFR